MKTQPGFLVSSPVGWVALVLFALWQCGCGVEPGTEEQKPETLVSMASLATATATQPLLPTASLTPAPSSTPTFTQEPPTATSTPAPPTPTRTPTEVQMVQVDIASLKQFPDLKYSFSGTLPEGNKAEVVLMDGEPLIEGATQTGGMWVAGLPASFELTVPLLGEAFRINRVEVTDPGGDKALHDCRVSLQIPGQTGWQQVPGVMSLRMQNGPGMKGDEGKSIFAFKPVRATAVRVEIPKGEEGTPDRIYVTDIDVFGIAPKGSIP